MELTLTGKAFRVLMAVITTVSITLVSCTRQGGTTPPPPPSGGGPQFIINSPQDGAQVSGPVFFSVQLLNPSEVRSVEFEAGGTMLEVDPSLGETMFKVFLIPAEFPDGSLELTATVTGNDGKSREQSITVVNVSNPPSSTMVSADGAVLASVEENGATSTLTIPPGVGEGASVSFEARTTAEVLAATGVDYEGLGVGFLGAQEITSDLPLDGPLGISSGGFGPMVQPGQAVVNYLIAPDSDNDGIDELVVVNTASVAPNGDVISDPVPQVQLGDSATVTMSSSSEFTTLQSGITGPPGTLIELEVAGFNPSSPLGNLAVYRSMVDGTEFTLPGMVEAVNDQGSSQSFNTAIPLLPVGPATLTLRNPVTGFETDPITVNVTAPVTSSKPDADVIDDFFASAILFVQSAPAATPEVEGTLNELLDRLMTAREVMQMFAGVPEAAEILENVAAMILGSGLVERLDSALVGELHVGSVAPAQQCLTQEEKRLLKDLLFVMGHGSAVACALAGVLGTGGLGSALAGLACASLLEILKHFIEKALDRIPTCEEPDPESLDVNCVVLPPIPITPGNLRTSTLRGQQGFNSGWTGMGFYPPCSGRLRKRPNSSPCCQPLDPSDLGFPRRYAGSRQDQG